jgi:hypothetical protein
MDGTPNTNTQRKLVPSTSTLPNLLDEIIPVIKMIHIKKTTKTDKCGGKNMLTKRKKMA